MLKYSFLFIFWMLSCNTLFAQKEYNYKDKYLIIDMDSPNGQFIGETFCKTRALKGKEIYVLNSRYKIKNNQRSRTGSDADFMFTFYIMPHNNKLQVEEIKNADTVISSQVNNLVNLSESMSRAEFTDGYKFSPIIKVNNRYFKFINCSLRGQAFNILEDIQYFPKYGATFDRYELNLLSKPYSKAQIDSISKLSGRDSTALVPFFSFAEDFYDKWYISKLDKTNRTIDFWAQFKRIGDGGNPFGRVTIGFTFKINIGITDFLMYPSIPDFSDEYFEKDYAPVTFNFVEFVDLKKFLPSK